MAARFERPGRHYDRRPRERLDGFDGQLYSYVVPTVIAPMGISAGTAGTIGTRALLTSSFGGWFAGSLSDRFGRVRRLQIAILRYSVFTFPCDFAQNFGAALLILHALCGLGFGAEWAAVRALMGEVIRAKYRVRGVGFVQTGAAIGPGSPHASMPDCARADRLPARDVSGGRDRLEIDLHAADEVRGAGQGFCCNGGRAIGALFPTIIGCATQVMPLGTAIALFCSSAAGSMIVMLALPTETRGRSVADPQPAPGAANN